MTPDNPDSYSTAPCNNIQLKNTRDTYGRVSKIFHWVMAVLIIAMLGFGYYIAGLPANPTTFQYYGWHKATGIIILMLAALRLLWKITNPAVTLPPHMSKKQRLLAQASHGLLYLMMFYMPLTGWLMSSAGGYPITLFGLVNVPPLIGKNKQLGGIFHELHEIGLWVFVALITLHVSAALIHHYYYRDNVLKHMLPHKLMKFFPAFTLWAVLSIASAAHAARYDIVKEQSFLTYAIIVNDKGITGKFTNFDADIVFDEERPQDALINATVRLTSSSIQSDDAKVTESIGSKDWLNTSVYSTATLQAKDFERQTDNTYKGRGKLTLLGQTHPVIIDIMVMDNHDGHKAVTSFFTLDRTLYGIGSNAKDNQLIDKDVVVAGYFVVKPQ